MSLSIKLTAAVAVTAAATTGSAGAEQRERARFSVKVNSQTASLSLSLPLLSHARAHNCWSISCCCSQQQCDLIVCVRQKYENKNNCIIYKNLHACKDLLPLLMIYVIAHTHTHTHRGRILVMRTVYDCVVHQLIVIAHYIGNQCKLIMHLPITIATMCSGKE